MSNLTVWKQELKPGVATYELPEGAQILSVAFQRGTPQMWYLCNPSPDHGQEDRVIVFTGTGHPLENVGAHKFIGTMLTEDQNFVFHVFERVNAWQ